MFVQNKNNHLVASIKCSHLINGHVYLIFYHGMCKDQRNPAFIILYTDKLIMRAIASLLFPEIRREAEGHSSGRGKP